MSADVITYFSEHVKHTSMIIYEFHISTFSHKQILSQTQAQKLVYRWLYVFVYMCVHVWLCLKCFMTH